MKSILCHFAILLFIISCGGDPFRVNVSGIQVDEVKISRFEQAIFTMDTSRDSKSGEVLRSQFGSFYDGFCRKIVLPENGPDSLFEPTLKLFISHPDMQQVYRETQKSYPDLTSLEKEIREVYRHWKYYFPETNSFPLVYSMVSGLNMPMSSSDSAIGIGLDMYLGKDHPIYDLAQFEKYRRKNMCVENILPDFVRAMSMTVFSRSGKENDLLSEMIYQGKVQLMIDLLTPHLNDTLKMGYSSQQLNWCLENESNIWSFLVKDKLIFTTEAQHIAQFINDGPFTSGLNKASPARTGIWIGWRIVRSWVEKNGMDLKKLWNTPAQELLNQSAYKP